MIQPKTPIDIQMIMSSKQMNRLVWNGVQAGDVNLVVMSLDVKLKTLRLNEISELKTVDRTRLWESPTFQSWTEEEEEPARD